MRAQPAGLEERTELVEDARAVLDGEDRGVDPEQTSLRR